MKYAHTPHRPSHAAAITKPGATVAHRARGCSSFLKAIASIVTLALTPVGVAFSANAVSLGAASSFAILGASTVTNTGSTIVTGDLGLSPGTAVTGFPPGVITGGVLRVNDGIAAAAQASNVTAYGLLAAQACDVTFAGPTDMAGMTLLPGTYCFNSSGANTGLLTLNGAGNSNAVWIFRTASTLITGAGSSVLPINGAQACNVFWQVGTSATLGTASQMIGNLLALTSITLTSGSSISGRALAQTGAVTLDTDIVSVCSIAPYAAPTLSKAFNLSTINVGATSTLTITLANQNGFQITTTAPLIDSLPSGVVIAPQPNVGTTCGGALASATAGGNSVTLPTGATVGANGSCTVSVNVTAALPGSYVNTLPVGALQTSNGRNALPAVATLNVVAPSVNPALSKAFNPSTINTGGVSTLTITLVNSHSTVATLTAALVDTLPTGVFVAPIPAGSTTCGGGTTVTATAGGTTVTLPGGRTIPANSSCTISVNVTSSVVGNYVNTLPIGALQTSNGNNPAPANATLNVIAFVPLVATAIPAIAPWMLGVLAAVLGVFGFVALRKRM
jgi:Ice-binding-like